MGSRLSNSIRNSFWGAFSNVVITIINFVVRTIFIEILGTEYLGINGLFTNILYVLSFAEMGVGHAITYSMYKPAAYNDKEKVKSLLKLYQKFYTIIGFAIFIIGILIIPLFPIIIKDPPNISENLIIIYLLYLFETASSYFLVYKRSILIVSQQDYVYDVVKLILQVVKAIVQIFVLLYTHNYILYLFIFVLSTFVTNAITCGIANKMYPFILDKNVIGLPKKEENKIIDNIKSLILYKLGKVSLSGTDNIIISALIGIVAVGLYSNYSLIISAVSGIAYILLKGTISSIGNVNAMESNTRKELLHKQILFVSAWLYGFITVCLAVLLDSFITLWIGEEYLIETSACLASLFYILVDGLEFSSHTYISTLGYFKQTKYSSLACALINIILSIVLGIKLGLFGIFIATSISKLLTTSWFDTYVLYKNEFKKSPKRYYFKHIKLIFCVMINYLVCNCVIGLIAGNTIMIFGLKCLLTIILCNLIFVIIFFKSEEFKNIWSLIFKEGKLWLRKN